LNAIFGGVTEMGNMEMMGVMCLAKPSEKKCALP